MRWRGVSRSGVQRSKINVLSSEPKEHKLHKSLCPGTWPGRLVSGVTGQSVMCQSCMCVFCSLNSYPPVIQLKWCPCQSFQQHYTHERLVLKRSQLGARLRGRTATQRSKKGSETVLGRVLGKGSQKGSEKGVCCGFCSGKGFREGFSEGVLRRRFPEGA